MGAVAHKAFKPFKNWNILNRAIKQIEREKSTPRPALSPKLDSAFNSINNEKNMKMVDGINKFEISSTEIIEGDRKPTKSNRPLPQRRLPYNLDFDEDAVEPIIVPEGKITVSSLIEMLEKYRGDITVEELADFYKLPPEKVYNVLRFNRLFLLTPPTDPDQLLIGDKATEPSKKDKQKTTGPQILYPEAYGKCKSSE